MMVLVPAMLALAGCAHDKPEGPQGRHGRGGADRPRVALPVVTALDVDNDGVIEAPEMDNAPKALRTLDKNGDGQLTKDEYLPRRP